jgi:hypothetical protein
VDNLSCSIVSKTTDNESALQSFLRRLDSEYNLIRMPSKGVSALFGWIELSSMKYENLANLAEQRILVKTGNSTFALPKFFLKQLKFYCACTDTQDKTIFQKIKRVFMSGLSLALSWIKLPMLFDKTNLIDLTQIARSLPDTLAKGATLLTLVQSGVKMAEGSWAIGSYLAQSHCAPKSSKAIKLYIKLGSSAIKLGGATIGAAALFFNIYFAPLALISLATVSFAVSLISKCICHSRLILGKPRPITYQLRIN